MSKIKLNDLKKAAKELNEVLGLNPAIDVKKSEEELLKLVAEACDMLEDDEITEFTDTVQDVISVLSASGKPVDEDEEEEEEAEIEEEEEEEEEEEIVEAPKKKAPKKKAPKKSVDADDEDEEPIKPSKTPPTPVKEFKKGAKVKEEAPEAAPVGRDTELEERILSLDIKALKELIAIDDRFASIRKGIQLQNNLEKLQVRALRCIMPDDVEDDSTKTAKSAVPVKEEKVKKEKPARDTTRPGVIATIVSILEKAGKAGISKEDILEKLCATFPDRAKASMKNTIQVQVPSGITKSGKFEVIKLANGNFAKSK